MSEQLLLYRCSRVHQREQVDHRVWRGWRLGWRRLRIYVGRRMALDAVHGHGIAVDGLRARGLVRAVEPRVRRGGAAQPRAGHAGDSSWYLICNALWVMIPLKPFRRLEVKLP